MVAQRILVLLEIKIAKKLMAFNKAMIAFLMVSTSACLRFRAMHLKKYQLLSNKLCFPISILFYLVKGCAIYVRNKSPLEWVRFIGYYTNIHTNDVCTLNV